MGGVAFCQIGKANYESRALFMCHLLVQMQKEVFFLVIFPMTCYILCYNMLKTLFFYCLMFYYALFVFPDNVKEYLTFYFTKYVYKQNIQYK